ncbi:MAG: SusC/RagA family TonB-linked outer membrane protein, partial [Tidjanibacter sp.]|nr:SusC/RagA family TonB-linked outer membrane protein [Tidjanibacter sp.]
SVVGTTVATTTNGNGEYAISAPKNASLEFSYVGMQTQTVAVAGRTSIDVKMEIDATQIEDIVVTAVGIQRSERSLGYAVSKVDADETVQKAEPDMLRSLEGKIPGVIIGSPSGEAGSATRVTIRGNSSFTGNNQPLYVVDGVPYSNAGTSASGRASGLGGAYGSGISTLDSNDIESMSVLKGAAAAALYGSRAANGVVLITTKSGSKKANANKGLEVTFNGSYTMENISSLPDYQNTYGQGNDFNAGGANGSWGAAFTDVDRVPLSFYSAVTANYPDLAKTLYPELVADDGTAYYAYKAFPNNVKDLFRTGAVKEASINVQSVNDRGNFNVTVSRTEQDSYIPGSEFERYSISVGGNQKLSNGLRVGGNIAVSNTKQKGSMYGNNQSSAAIGAASSLARAFIMPRSFDIQNFPYEQLDGSNLLFQLSAQANNPYWAWKHDTITSEQDRTVANFNAGYDFNSWLSLDYTFGINEYKSSRKTVLDLGSRGNAGEGYIGVSRYDLQEMESTLLLQANKEIGDDINVKATLGHNYNQQTSENFGATGLQIINPGIFQVGNTKTQTASESYARTRKWGIFADLMLSYKNWAFLNLTGRNDFSSTLPKSNQSYFYPAIAASFVYTEAFGLQNDVIDFGKLRASWAKVGNDAGAYYVNGYYATGSPYMGQSMMELPTTLFDENLSPEFTREVEIGVEQRLFGGRIGLDFAWYRRISDNQIGAVEQPASTGYSTFVTNFGSLQNQGIEVGLDIVPVMVGDFKWNAYITFTRNRSKILELNDKVDMLFTGGDFSNPRPALIVGQPYGVLYGETIARTEDGTPLVDPGSGMYINNTEYGVIGDPNPDYKTSMINNLTYKGLTFSFMIDFQKGGCVYSSYLTDLLGRGVTKDTEDRLGTRILPGVYGDVNTQTALKDADGNYIHNTIALAEADLWFSAGSLSTFAINSADEVAVYDATTVRLREISLGYDLPKSWFKKIGIGSMNISVVGRNLWFYAPNVPKYSNYDPTSNTFGETNVQGIDYTSAPSTRRIGFNIRMTF